MSLKALAGIGGVCVTPVEVREAFVVLKGPRKPFTTVFCETTIRFFFEDSSERVIIKKAGNQPNHIRAKPYYPMVG